MPTAMPDFCLTSFGIVAVFVAETVDGLFVVKSLLLHLTKFGSASGEIRSEVCGLGAMVSRDDQPHFMSRDGVGNI